MGEDGPPGPPGITGVRVSVPGFVPALGASGDAYCPRLCRQLDRRSFDGSHLRVFRCGPSSTWEFPKNSLSTSLPCLALPWLPSALRLAPHSSVWLPQPPQAWPG